MKLGDCFFHLSIAGHFTPLPVLTLLFALVSSFYLLPRPLSYCSVLSLIVLFSVLSLNTLLFSLLLSHSSCLALIASPLLPRSLSPIIVPAHCPAFIALLPCCSQNN